MEEGYDGVDATNLAARQLRRPRDRKTLKALKRGKTLASLAAICGQRATSLSPPSLASATNLHQRVKFVASSR